MAEQVLDALLSVTNKVLSLPDCYGPMRRSYYDLFRRLNLLSPLFEELKDNEKTLGLEDIRGLKSLLEALEFALEFLQSISGGSKIYQALCGNIIAHKFIEVNKKIEVALSGISYNKLDISEEVQEQIELLHNQFKRTESVNFSDSVADDLRSTLHGNFNDGATLKRLSDKLQIRTVDDVEKETLALQELKISTSDVTFDHGEIIHFLKKLKDYLILEFPETNEDKNDKKRLKHRSPVIPEDFRCPISLELMKDPVIVSTGQTYERSCIQKWLDAGHKTCPKTQQTLSYTALTPNYVLKSLIAQWCEANGFEPLKRPEECNDKTKLVGYHSDCDKKALSILFQRLTCDNINQQRAAAGEIRLLAKRNADNRICIAEAGVIPLLIKLLTSPDPRTQEHAVTALLNLSIHESNKTPIVNTGAIPGIVEVLKNGSMEARENAAATLFSLSVTDDIRNLIGMKGAIPPLIDLLSNGSSRGKKDAATAIFNLVFYPGNRVKAVEAGIVLPLMDLLQDSSAGMVDEALAILIILATHPEGKYAVGKAKPIRAVLELMKTGTSRNRENAVALLWPLCFENDQNLMDAVALGAEQTLKELSQCGTERAKRKAKGLLDLIHKPEKNVLV